MNKKASGEAFTKIAGKLLVGVRDLVEWGVEGGHTTPERLRLTVAARREETKALIESGMSQRQVAKALGVPKSTVARDVGPQGGERVPHNGPPKPNAGPSVNRSLLPSKSTFQVNATA